MDGWASYRPSDFVLFSARAWWRTVEAANVAMWPLQVATLAIGVALLGVVWRRRADLAPAAWVGAAGAWVCVAWFFHATHHAAIDWSAPFFAAAFAFEAALLVVSAAAAAATPAMGARRTSGLALLLAGVAAYPLVALAAGRAWPAQAEAFGAMPDPTAVATLGLLLALPPSRRWLATLLWPIPLASLAVSGVLLATMR